MTLDEALKCADAAAINQWSRPSETAATVLAAEVRRLQDKVADQACDKGPLRIEVAEQAALIEKCRVGFLKVKDKKHDAPLLDIIADAYIAAIAAQKGGAA